MATASGVVVEISANIARLADGVNSSIRMLGSLDKNTQAVSKRIDTQTNFLKRSWMNVGAAIYTVRTAVYMLDRVFDATFGKGIQAVEDYKQSVITASAVTLQVMDVTKYSDLGEAWRVAQEYAAGMVPILEEVAIETALTGQQTNMLFTQFAKHGALLDATNQQAIRGFKAMANAVAIMTKGQGVERQIMSEINALMEGQARQGAVIYDMLKKQIPNLKEQLEIWKKTGSTFENLLPYLRGFDAASGQIKMTWAATKTTIETTVNRILREGMIGAYEEIIEQLHEMNDWLTDNKEELKETARILASGMLETIKAIAKGFYEIATFGKNIGVGLWFIVEVTKEIRHRVGSLIQSMMEWANILKGIGLIFTGIFSLDKEQIMRGWNEAKTAFSKSGTDFRNAFKSGFTDQIQEDWRNAWDTMESITNEKSNKLSIKPPATMVGGIDAEKAKKEIDKLTPTIIKLRREMLLLSIPDDFNRDIMQLRFDLQDLIDEFGDNPLWHEFFDSKAAQIELRRTEAFTKESTEIIGLYLKEMYSKFGDISVSTMQDQDNMLKELEVFAKRVADNMPEINWFGEGVAKGTDDYLETLKWGFDRGEDLARESFTSMENFFQDLFIGKVKLSWESMLGWMGNIFSKFLAEITTKMIAQTGLVQGILKQTGSIVPGIGSSLRLGAGGLGGGFSSLLSLAPGIGTIGAGAMMGGSAGTGMMIGGGLGLATGMGGLGGGAALAALGGTGALGASIATFLATSAFAIPIIGAIGAGIALLIDSLLSEDTMQQKFRVVGGELHTYGDMGKKKQAELLDTLQPMYDAFVDMAEGLGLEAEKLFDVGRWGLEDEGKISSKELMNSFYRGLLDALDMDTEIFKKFKKDGEKYYETIQRVMYAFAEGIPRTVKSIDAYINAIENSDDVLALYIDQLNQADQNIKDIKDALSDATDPTDAVTYAEQLKQAIYDRYIYERDLINGIVQSISNMEVALAEFSMDIQKKINDLAGIGNVDFLFDAMQDAFSKIKDLKPEQALAELQRGIGYLDEWVSESVAAIGEFYEAQKAALQSQIDSINAQITVLQDSKSAINDQIDAIRDQINVSEKWKSVLDSVKKQILDMQTSLDNPRDAFERMNIAYSEIMKVKALYQSATGEDKAAYASELQDLIKTYMGVSQEALQRPSPEYQAIYAEMISLLGSIQGDAEGFAVSQEDYLRQISELQAQSADIDAQIVAYQENIAQLQQQMADLDAQMAVDIRAFKDEAVTYYEWAKSEGIRLYQESIEDMKERLSEIIGDKTVEEYLADLQLAAVTELVQIRQILSDLLHNTFPDAELPQMQSGGITTRSVVAQLHANEAIIPLDRSGSFGVNIGGINIYTSGDVDSQDLANTIEKTLIHSIKHGRAGRVMKQEMRYVG